MDSLACPQCGSDTWEDYEHASETIRLRLHVEDPEEPWGTEKSTYYEINDSDGWHCENDHEPTDEINDRLMELRSEIDFVQ